MILYLEASKKQIQITDKELNGVFLGIKEGSAEFIVGTPAGCVVSTASVEHPGDCCQKTSRESPENQGNSAERRVFGC